ncbi:MAG: hypothetical protein AMXMBFR8_01190 [Nevskiales bacterium]
MTESTTNRLLAFLGLGGRVSQTSEKEDMQPIWQLLQAGQYEAAEKDCRRILRFRPRHVEANLCLGALHQRARRFEDSIDHFRKVLALAPDHVPAHANLADSLMELERYDDAWDVIDHALKVKADSTVAERSLGGACFRLCRYEDAVACYRRALATEPDEFRNHLGLAMALRYLGHAEEALAAYDKAITLRPGDPDILRSRGHVLSDLGRLEDAAAAYRASIRLKPAARTYELLASTRKHVRYDAEIKAMEALHDRPTTSPDERMIYAFGLGKAFEDLRDYDKAFSYFAGANRQRRSIKPYTPASDDAFFARLEATFSAQFLAQHQGLGRSDATPIFILGMPRSGTSLVEQILASHPMVHGGGELPDLPMICTAAMKDMPASVERLQAPDWQRLADRYLARLRARNASKPHVTDKMPFNFLRIGMIATMLPNARIIHLRRDPVDTCLSGFKYLFATAGMEWTYDLADLGHYYALYRDLMAHWRRVLPGKIVDVQYEDLVAQPEAGIRALLDAIGLPFDAGCLAFHQTKHAVRTRSATQVRQPIYGSSVQAWRRYEQHLRPLLEALGEPPAASR